MFVVSNRALFCSGAVSTSRNRARTTLDGGLICYFCLSLAFQAPLKKKAHERENVARRTCKTECKCSACVRIDARTSPGEISRHVVCEWKTNDSDEARAARVTRPKYNYGARRCTEQKVATRAPGTDGDRRCGFVCFRSPVLNNARARSQRSARVASRRRSVSDTCHCPAWRADMSAPFTRT